MDTNGEAKINKVFGLRNETVGKSFSGKEITIGIEAGQRWRWNWGFQI